MTNLHKSQKAKNFITSVQVPLATDSYSPVSHRNIIENIYEQLDRKGLSVKNENYLHNSDGTKVVGWLSVQADDPELGFMLAFKNSYDKSMSLGFVAGSICWACLNGMLKGDTTFIRKHTGSINGEITNKIIENINQFDNTLKDMIIVKDRFKDIQVDKTVSAELLGRMFIQEDIITSTQLGIVKRELDFSANFKQENAWTLYNNVTESLKTSHPLNYIESHKKLHVFMEKEFFHV